LGLRRKRHCIRVQLSGAQPPQSSNKGMNEFSSHSHTA
jgi:hypothetical protein